ncbi:MAG: aminotransferase class IV [Pirellulales bacterium]|nr:aminotransferase class IV [Pirellulales bacterium]
MDRPQAYLNGRFVPDDEARISVTDAGFVLGVTLSEQLRTFDGQIFRLEDHVARLQRSLVYLGLAEAVSLETISAAARDLVEVNFPLLHEGSDLGLSMVVTPGPYGTFASGQTAPTVCLHTYELPFARWANKYRGGEHLIVTPFEQVSPRSWPREIKCRSRMHYYLADRCATQHSRSARALLLDQSGAVLETTTANVLVYRQDEGLISPPLESVLPGISLAVTMELAAAQGITCVYRELSVEQVATADEVLVTSTPNCVLPVTRVNDREIADGSPGPIYARLMAAWSREAGLDIEGQARARALLAS